MFRKLTLACLLLLATAVGTRSVSPAAVLPVHAAEATAALPSSPTAPILADAAQGTPLSTVEMSADKGDGLWGWIKKMWKKYKKKIIKIVWQIISEVIENIINGETQEQSASVSGTVVEYYEGTDTTEEVYASQAAYNASQVQSTSYADGGYAYQYTDYSYGSYGGGGEY